MNRLDNSSRFLREIIARDELFRTMQNIHNIPYTVLATVYSDLAVISRHGEPDTGCHEPIALVGQYGEGRTYDRMLGHVRLFCTGHGLCEDTMVSFAPRPFRQMFVRGCEWAATGKMEQTLDFDGSAILWFI